MNKLIGRISRSIRYRLGFRVANPALESGERSKFVAHYQERITHCQFLSDPEHYEHPRARWVVESLGNANQALEIGCGDGGMTTMVSPMVKHITALDVSEISLEQVRKLELPNVTTACALVEEYRPETQFDVAILSEVIEHVLEPEQVLRAVIGQLAPGGRLLITTPNGHWESDEHIHIWTMPSLFKLLAKLDCESVEIGYIRDIENKRRWLSAVLTKPISTPAPDDFHSKVSTMRKRVRS